MPVFQPPSPGSFIAETLAHEKMSILQLSHRIGVSTSDLEQIISGRKSITPFIAEGLSAVIGYSPIKWLKMQKAYDIWHQRN